MKNSSVPKILVTGSKGFIASHIIKNLKQFEIVQDFVDDKRVNFNNKDDVLNLKKSDIVIHTAASIPTINEEKVPDYVTNNVKSTMNILEYCIQKNVQKIIYVSSYIYGIPEYNPVDENHPINPHNLYAESKYLGEKLCMFYAKNKNLKTTIIRPFNICGKSQKLGFLLPNLINSLKTGTSVEIINKESKRDFLFVDDLVSLILKLMSKDFNFEIFNVGSGKSYSFEYIVKLFEQISNKKINVRYSHDEKNLIEDIRADISKVTKMVNWKPNLSLEKGIMRLFDK